MTFRQRIAFLDVDGTIIDHGERIAPSTIEAIRTARANGHLVYLSTGRAATEIYPIISDIGFDGAVLAGGGFARIGEKLVISRTMPQQATERMVDWFEQAGYDFYLQSFTDLFPSPGVRDRFAHYLNADRGTGGPGSVVEAGEEHPALRRFADVRPYPGEGIAKAVFLGDDETAYDRAVEAFAGEFHVITGTIAHLGRGAGEVTLHGVNKGTTIVQLLEHLGLDLADSIGIGDNGNDVEMLQLCGVGIAMGNAADEIKAHADEVTTAVLDDGIWNAFRKHGLV